MTQNTGQTTPDILTFDEACDHIKMVLLENEADLVHNGQLNVDLLAEFIVKAMYHYATGSTEAN